ncbi:MAG: apolipoprotein N-acyltransferase, partial [Actinomycetota bacterium]|nr:apolipoprotein N-acyltransferase [Actinomycetota bacterium]
MFGIGFFGVLIYWFSIVGWLAWGLAVLLESLFTALFAGSWAFVSRRLGTIASVPVATVLWVSTEFLRSRIPWGGFTWGELAQSQHNLQWMLRSAGVAGAWGTGALLVSVNGFLWAGVFFYRTHRGRALGCVLAAA